jgi:hypothetical protein
MKASREQQLAEQGLLPLVPQPAPAQRRLSSRKSGSGGGADGGAGCSGTGMDGGVSVMFMPLDLRRPQAAAPCRSGQLRWRRYSASCATCRMCVWWIRLRQPPRWVPLALGALIWRLCRVYAYTHTYFRRVQKHTLLVASGKRPGTSGCPSLQNGHPTGSGPRCPVQCHGGYGWTGAARRRACTPSKAPHCQIPGRGQPAHPP